MSEFYQNIGTKAVKLFVFKSFQAGRQRQSCLTKTGVNEIVMEGWTRNDALIVFLIAPGAAALLTSDLLVKTS